MKSDSSSFSPFFKIILLLFGAILLCFMGWKNHYPLFHYDSGAYIYPAFEFYVPKDRPLIYGLFVRLFSLNYSLWGVILAQGFILSLSLYYYFAHFAHPRRSTILFIFCLFVLTFLTTAPIYVSMISPDIFTSILILNLGLLLFMKQIGKLDLVIITFLFMLSLAVHNAHFLLGFLVLMLVSIGWLFKRVKELFPHLSLKRMGYIWTVFVAAWLLSASVHYLQARTGEHIYGHVFTTGEGGPIFLMSRFSQTGILADFLEEHCDQHQYSLCQYRDSLPDDMDFLWKEDSPLYKTGGWKKNEEEYKGMIFDILSSPKYLGAFIWKSLETSIALFFSFDAIQAPVIREIEYADRFINKCYPAYRNEYLQSLQNNNKINPMVDRLNRLQEGVFALTFLLLPFLFIFSASISKKQKALYLYFFGFLVLNAFVCASLSIIDTRYQGRIVWLLCIPFLLLLFESGLLVDLRRRLFDSDQ
jgi:hypothetical protein